MKSQYAHDRRGSVPTPGAAQRLIGLASTHAFEDSSATADLVIEINSFKRQPQRRIFKN
jgi:hypothetical protein